MNKAALRDELMHLLNRHSVENGSDTPDYILADYLLACLAVWETTIKQRERWHGRDGSKGAVLEVA